MGSWMVLCTSPYLSFIGRESTEKLFVFAAIVVTAIAANVTAIAIAIVFMLSCLRWRSLLCAARSLVRRFRRLRSPTGNPEEVNTPSRIKELRGENISSFPQLRLMGRWARFYSRKRILVDENPER